MRDSGHYHNYGWKDKINIWTPEEGEGCGAFDDFQTIPVLSEFTGMCAICDVNYAKKNIYYERHSFGQEKGFDEEVCEDCCNDCMNDGDYLDGKENINVTKII